MLLALILNPRAKRRRALEAAGDMETSRGNSDRRVVHYLAADIYPNMPHIVRPLPGTTLSSRRNLLRKTGQRLTPKLTRQHSTLHNDRHELDRRPLRTSIDLDNDLALISSALHTPPIHVLVATILVHHNQTRSSLISSFVALELISPLRSSYTYQGYGTPPCPFLSRRRDACQRRC